MADTPTAFHDLPAEAFPFTVEFFRVSDRVVMHTVIVHDAGLLRVPSNAELGGEPVGVRTTYADGTVQETVP